MAYLNAHQCSPICEKSVYCFIPLVRPRRLNTQDSASTRHQNVAIRAEAIAESHATVESYTPYTAPTTSLRNEIIKDWQAELSTENQKNGVCGCCSSVCRAVTLKKVPVDQINFKLLCNDDLPAHVLPISYNLAAYDNALLDPDGLSNKDMKEGSILLCKPCHKDLTSKKPQMPTLSLANWLYYGRDRLPPDIKEAFDSASVFEKSLICRGRASRITFRYCKNPESVEFGRNPATSQGYSKGNIIVMPQDSLSLTKSLPPSTDDIRDSLCILFIGSSTVPVAENVRKLAPCMVRKSRVSTLINFLINNNPHYAISDLFTGFSAENLDSLSLEQVENDEEFTPANIEIAHLDPTTSIGEIDVTADYTNRNDADPQDDSAGNSDLLIENVGYTDGDTSPANYNLMKLQAVQHCLSGGSFLQSRSGSQAENDFENPVLLSWLFPHLDPWGIGGFHEARRSRIISLEQQLRHLISIKNSPFASDPTFAFVFHNISQKKQATRDSLWRVKRHQHAEVTVKLLETPPDLLMRLQAKFEQNPKYHPTDEAEIQAIQLLAKIQSLNNRLPDSNGYKKRLRNEIRSMIHRFGAPSLFITINPSDVNNPLVRLIAGHDINLEDMTRGEPLSKFLRQKLVAKNPHIAAKFFDRVIKAFIQKILRYEGKKPGLFGKCNAYYGVVEAQGKGTLHCHFLIWIEGHYSPQKLRDTMAEDLAFKQQFFSYLESIIKCEPPGITREVSEEPGTTLNPPERPRDAPSPSTLPLPQCDRIPAEEFDDLFQRCVHDLVVENHWHRHNATCWKYLKRGEPKDDAHCRMRIDGSTRASTEIDPESGSILLRRLHPRVNCYNDVLAFLTQSNNDIKFIGSGEAAKALLYCITDYVTKATLPTHVGLSAIRVAMEKNGKKFDGDVLASPEIVSRSLFVKVANGILSRMEMSHQQIMGYILGNDDHYTGCKFATLFWGCFDRAVAAHFRSLDQQENEGFDATSELTIRLGGAGITTNNQYDDYVFRPENEPFSSRSLYKFVQHFHKVTISKVERTRGEEDSERNPRPRNPSGAFLPGHPSAATHRLSRKTTEVIPVMQGPTIPHPQKGPAAKEQWARAMVILFKPGRSIADLKDPQETWLDAYNRLVLSSELSCIVDNMLVLEECKDARDADMTARRSRPVFSHMDANAGDEVERLVMSLDLDGAQEVISGDMERCWEDEGEAPAVNQRAVAQALGIPLGEGEEDAELRDVATSLMVDDWQKEELKVHAAMMARLKKNKRKRDDSDDDSDDDLDEEETTHQAKRRRTLASSDVTTLEANAESLRLRTGMSTAHNPAIPNTNTVAQQVAHEFNLDSNPEQLRAFTIIADRVVRGGSQLLMYVGGVGGTGKSHLIKAIVELFKRLGRRSELQLSAPTGAAGVIIDGSTIHSLTGLPNKRNVKSDPLQEIWRGKTFLVLDEISMVGANLLADISARINIGKGNEESSRDTPFGAINVLFTGDFGQLKPVGERCLYSNELVDCVSAATSASTRGQNELLGATIWRQVTDVVILQKNQRQRDDPLYASLLGRVRSGSCFVDKNNPNERSDHSILSGRVLSRLTSADSILFSDAPIVVGRRAIRDPLNNLLLRSAAQKLGVSVHNYHSIDRLHGERLEDRVQQKMWKVSSTITKDTFGILPLFAGMRVMITENLAIGSRLVNGMEGIVKRVVYTIDENNRRYPEACYVLVKGSGVQLDGEELDVVPILPVARSFTYKPRLGKSISISRLQLPLIPAYSYTDYKSQGRTLERAIVDLKSAQSLQGVYVMLSRVKSLNGLAILHDFPTKFFGQRLSEELRNEFARLDELDHATTTAYAHLLRKDDAQVPVEEDAMDL
ncbi:hypothetical protein M408DRAFT_77987 [Serendipita vermifera MAFF 305830]|uniref:ATP-dependent DNA helicase n=1 Tax=Serendipita vermifera MAFF 305830 TaxID=933852 RepID=A0A0C3AET3_SERVB|nr:hypothetical protein M408DRAFT_77987 [Serendipita vermifera MAFF 305830]